MPPPFSFPLAALPDCQELLEARHEAKPSQYSYYCKGRKKEEEERQEDEGKDRRQAGKQAVPGQNPASVCSTLSPLLSILSCNWPEKSTQDTQNAWRGGEQSGFTPELV